MIRCCSPNTGISTPEEKGTGLGLIICKEYVKKNGGEIWLETHFKKGSEFIFNVKMKRVADAPETFTFVDEHNFYAVYVSLHDKAFDAVNSVFAPNKLCAPTINEFFIGILTLPTSTF